MDHFTPESVDHLHRNPQANTFDREYKNILELHSEVAHAIAREVTMAFPPEEVAGNARNRLVSPEAYEYYLRGMEHTSRTETENDYRAAIQMFEKSVAVDPRFAPAFAALSEAHARMWWMYYDRTQERIAQAKGAADRALQLQPELSETHRALGYFHYMCLQDYDLALQEFAKAQETKPNDSQTSAGIGYVLRRQGKMEQSMIRMRKAVALDPLSANLADNAATTCGLMRNSDEAIRYRDVAIRFAPDWPAPYARKISNCLRLSGDVGKARSVVETTQKRGMSNDPNSAVSHALLDLYAGTYHEAATRLDAASWELFESQFHFVPRALLQAQVYGLLKEPRRARSYYDVVRKLAEEKVQKQPEEPIFHGALGIAYAGLGRKADAIREGKVAVALLPVTKDAFRGFYRVEDLAQIYAMVGEQEAAIGQLEYLMSIPGDLGIGALRLDPTWNPLRQHPRFKALLRRYGG